MPEVLGCDLNSSWLVLLDIEVFQNQIISFSLMILKEENSIVSSIICLLLCCFVVGLIIISLMSFIPTLIFIIRIIIIIMTAIVFYGYLYKYVFIALYFSLFFFYLLNTAKDTDLTTSKVSVQRTKRLLSQTQIHPHPPLHTLPSSQGPPSPPTHRHSHTFTHH